MGWGRSAGAARLQEFPTLRQLRVWLGLQLGDVCFCFPLEESSEPVTLVHRHMAGWSDFELMENVVSPINLVESSPQVCPECPELMQNKTGKADGQAIAV